MTTFLALAGMAMMVVSGIAIFLGSNFGTTGSDIGATGVYVLLTCGFVSFIGAEVIRLLTRIAEREAK